MSVVPVTRLGVFWLLVVVVLSPGCTSRSSSSPRSADDAPSSVASSKMAGGDRWAQNPCFSSFNESGAKRTTSIAGRRFERQGTTLNMAADDDNLTRLGVLGNIKEFSAANQKALKEYVLFFKKRKVDAIVVTGDIGESELGIYSALKALSEAGVPVLALTGNRENGGDFQRATDRLPGVINLNKIRLVRMDDHHIVSVPGYYDPNYIHAKGGCLYGEAELSEVQAALHAARNRPTLVVSHGPHLQRGPRATDVVSEGDHVGNVELTKLFETAQVKFGVASNIQEAGGRATNRDGTLAISQNTFTRELFFNPGGADRSVAWKMLSGQFAHGMVGFMTLRGPMAAHEVVYLPAPAE